MANTTPAATTTPAANTARSATATRAAACGLTALLALAGCGGAKSTPRAPAAPVGQSAGQPAGRVAPQWVPIATLTGATGATRTVDVPRDALQWRTRWECRSGRLGLTVTPPPRGGRSLEQSCPSIGKAMWAGTGAQRLQVRASDRWRVVVEGFRRARSAAAPSR